MPSLGELLLFGLLVAAVLVGGRLDRLGDAIGSLWRRPAAARDARPSEPQASESQPTENEPPPADEPPTSA